MPENFTSRDELRSEIAKRRVIAVAGAGLAKYSTNNDLADWKGLLRHGVEHCVNWDLLRPDMAEIANAEIVSGDLLSAAEKIWSALDTSRRQESPTWLHHSVGSLQVVTDDLIKALAALEVPIVTTNYDKLIETVTGLPTITWQDSGKLEEFVHGDLPAVLHLHGVFDRPETVVFGIRSYEHLVNHQHFQGMLRVLATVQSMLFIGFGAGLSDPNFAALRQWSQQVRAGSRYHHFRLVREGEREAAVAEHRDDRIAVLSYGADYNDLPFFLRGLRTPTDRQPQMDSSSGFDSRTRGAVGTATTSAEHHSDGATWQRLLSTAVVGGYFVPVLGSDALLDTRFDDDHRALQDEIFALAVQFPANSPARQYLRSVLPRDVQGKIHLDIPQGRVKKLEARVHLQTALVRLGVSATALLGRVLARGARSIADARLLEVQIGDYPGGPNGSAVRAALLEAAQAAKSLRESAPAGSPGASEWLEPDKLHRLILLLGLDMFPDLRPERGIPARLSGDAKGVWHKWHAHDAETLASVNNGARRDRPETETIATRHLTCIRDLLWYTLRCAHRVYPSEEELAFQLRLMRVPTVESIPRKIVAYQTDVPLLETLLSYYARGMESRPPAQLHQTIADYLQQTFGAQVRQDMGGPSHLRGPSQNRLVVAFTASFDKELERALDRLRQPYHVVLPVMSDLNPDNKLTWVMGSVASRISPPWVVLPNQQQDKNIDKFYLNLEGPVVVHIHGSPLFDIGEIHREIPHAKMMDHCLVLEERGYFRNIFESSWGFPPALSDIKRRFFFIGHALAPSHNRLRFVQYMQRGGKTKVDTQNYHCIVEHIELPFVDQAVTELDIKVHRVLLNDMIDVMNSALLRAR